MRIIDGEWRRRLVQAPPGDTTRPTADRTRETLFAMLTSRLGSFEGLRVADLFAGSGALGLEALSRGAASCLFVEHDAAALCSHFQWIGRSLVRPPPSHLQCPTSTSTTHCRSWVTVGIWNDGQTDAGRLAQLGSARHA